MKVKRIIPCVCIERKPDTAVTIHYGMPELRKEMYKEIINYDL